MNWTMISFILATAAVAVGTVFFVRRMKRSENAIEDYFAGGRSLAWPVVAGSLLLTNLSTEQLVRPEWCCLFKTVDWWHRLGGSFRVCHDGHSGSSCLSIWPVVLLLRPVTSSSVTTA